MKTVWNQKCNFSGAEHYAKTTEFHPSHRHNGTYCKFHSMLKGRISRLEGACGYLLKTGERRMAPWVAELIKERGGVTDMHRKIVLRNGCAIMTLNATLTVSSPRNVIKSVVPRAARMSTQTTKTYRRHKKRA